MEPVIYDKKVVVTRWVADHKVELTVCVRGREPAGIIPVIDGHKVSADTLRQVYELGGLDFTTILNDVFRVSIGEKEI